MAQDEFAIRVDGLRKTFRVFKRRVGLLGAARDLFQRRYTDLHAVDGISFTVRPGEMIGLIGPNGAGKSTTLKMLTGILVPTAGEVNVAGYVPFKNRIAYVRHIGAVFGQRTQLWWDLAVTESFQLLGKIYGVEPARLNERIDELDGILDLAPLMHTPVRKLSLGQRMRCDLAASLLHDPKILFLDEPTIGLDIVAKDGIRDFLKRINRQFGTTAIITTHDLRDIEELCERIVIIDHGQLLFDGPLDEIKAAHAGETRLVVDLLTPPSDDVLRAVGGDRVSWEKTGPLRYRATFDRRALRPAELARAAFERLDIADLAIPEPSIERIIGRIYRDGDLSAPDADTGTAKATDR